MSSQWYYAKGGQRQGPVTDGELKRLAIAGQLQASDLVCKEGMAQWVAAKSLKGLFPTTLPAAVPVIPPIPAGATPVAVSERSSLNWRLVSVVFAAVVSALFIAVLSALFAWQWLNTPNPSNSSNVFTRDQARAAKTQISELEKMVEAYHFDVGTYPASLDGLIQPPGNAGGSGKWNGPYVKKQQHLLDPWEKPIQYACPGSHGQDFDIWTESPDGKVIGSWD